MFYLPRDFQARVLTFLVLNCILMVLECKWRQDIFEMVKNWKKSIEMITIQLIFRKSGLYITSEKFYQYVQQFFKKPQTQLFESAISGR